MFIISIKLYLRIYIIEFQFKKWFTFITKSEVPFLTKNNINNAINALLEII